MTKPNIKINILFAFLRALAIVTIAHYTLVYLFPAPSSSPSPSAPVASSSDHNDDVTSSNSNNDTSATEMEISPNGEIISTSSKKKKKQQKKKKEPIIEIKKVTKYESISKHVKRTTLSPSQQSTYIQAQQQIQESTLPPTKTNQAANDLVEARLNRKEKIDEVEQSVHELKMRVEKFQKDMERKEEKDSTDGTSKKDLGLVVENLGPVLQMDTFAHVSDKELQILFESALSQLKSITDTENERKARVLDVLDQVWEAAGVTFQKEDNVKCDDTFLKRELVLEEAEEDTPAGQDDDDEEDEEEEMEGIAREEDMKNHIEQKIQPVILNRQSFLQNNTEKNNVLHPLMERGVLHFQKMYYETIQRNMKSVHDTQAQKRISTRQLEKQYNTKLRLTLAQIEREHKGLPCANVEMIEGMVRKGLDALVNKQDLSSSILSVLGQKEAKDVELEEVTLLDYPYFTDESLTSSGNVKSSWKHRGSLRQVIDKPLFYKSLSKLDALLEYVEGYNDHVDRAIDTIAHWGQDEEERYNNEEFAYDGSVGKTVSKVLLDGLGKVKVLDVVEGDVKEQALQMKDKAGILM